MLQMSMVKSRHIHVVNIRLHHLYLFKLSTRHMKARITYSHQQLNWWELNWIEYWSTMTYNLCFWCVYSLMCWNTWIIVYPKGLRTIFACMFELPAGEGTSTTYTVYSLQTPRLLRSHEGWTQMQSRIQSRWKNNGLLKEWEWNWGWLEQRQGEAGGDCG